MSNSPKEIAKKLLKYADVKINGSRPWDIQVHNEDIYKRVLTDGTLGLGEAYMEGWWDCKSLDTLFTKFLKADLDKKRILTFKEKIGILKNIIFNQQTKRKSLKVAHEHYDLSPDLYMSFLDPYNQYTCGYFKNTKDLNKAQEYKLDLICKKLKLNSKDKVLDIGCGWGGFAKYASSKYGCEVTGITISESQAKYAREFTKGLPVKIIVQDYREIKGEFDKVLICGMIEHVGLKNYGTIMKIVNNVLKDSGLFLLHTIGTKQAKATPEPWINKYIFPNSIIPTMESITKAAADLFVMEDWHNFSAYYDQTLMAWFKNFNKNWPKLKKQYDEKFYRMFKYYLLICAGTFRSRNNQLWQIVFSKKGVPGVYQTVR